MKWNDSEIARLNPRAKLPDTSIVVVHRSDGSGTSYIFTDFLSRVSSEWKSKVGVGKSVSWPAPSSVGAKGNEGVAGQVRSTPGAIGYVELAYVIENHMPAALLQNRAEKWVAMQYGDRRRGGRQQAGGKLDQLLDRGRCRREFISGFGLFVDRGLQEACRCERAKLLYDVLSWLAAPRGPIQRQVGGLRALAEERASHGRRDAQADATLIGKRRAAFSPRSAFR